MNDGFLSYHIPNMILAAAMYTLLGRYFLSLFFRADSQAVMWRVFRQITDPILVTVGFITPAVVPHGLLILAAVVWIFALRVLFFLAAVMFGFAPTLGSLTNG